jgi:hypothetical protein
MLWPVAALAVFVLGFVVVYGSVLQSRLDGKSRVDGHQSSSGSSRSASRV